MQLYQLFSNFLELSYSEQERFIRSYRERRFIELQKAPKKSKGPKLSVEEKALMKKLGLRQKDLQLLKEIL